MSKTLVSMRRMSTNLAAMDSATPTLHLTQDDLDELLERKIRKDLRMMVLKIVAAVGLGISHAVVALVSSGVTYVVTKYV